jgi:hypothetical protein
MRCRATVDLFREYRGLTVARRNIFDRIGDVPRDVPFTQLPDAHGLRNDAFRVSHFLDNLGLLVTEGALEANIAAAFLGTTAIALWVALEPHINAERELRRREGYLDSEYQRYFEDLAVTIRDIDPVKARRHLKRWSGEVTTS